MPGPNTPRGQKPKVNNPMKLLFRLLAYIMKSYAIAWIVVAICIVTTVLSTVQGTLFMQTLIDD
ncbi:MAG: ABC transporter ATP-binding protein, partial [Clostridiales bacterium]|nr:ABC transporter ATP-binding protein [Clostridiales bacterium]